MGSEIECPSCNSKNNVRTRTDRKLSSFVVTFEAKASRRCLQCQDCGNRFQVIAVTH